MTSQHADKRPSRVSQQITARDHAASWRGPHKHGTIGSLYILLMQLGYISLRLRATPTSPLESVAHIPRCRSSFRPDLWFLVAWATFSGSRTRLSPSASLGIRIHPPNVRQNHGELKVTAGFAS